MSRQLDQEHELRVANRQAALDRALEYGLPGALESQGDELLGIAIKYQESSCLMTIKGIIDGVRSVAFVGSDTMGNCVLKAATEARRHSLRWRPDKYHLD